MEFGLYELSDSPVQSAVIIDLRGIKLEINVRDVTDKEAGEVFSMAYSLVYFFKGVTVSLPC